MHKATAAKLSALALGATLTFGASAADASKAGWKQCLKTEPARFDGTIVEAALATPALSTLVDLVVAANLVDALNAPGNLTVFAPTNDAFSAIPEPVLGAIGSDIDVLTAVLTYHVTAIPTDPRRALKPREVPTLQGQGVFVEYDGAPQINQSNAACQAVRTSNGTVWLIDSVLLPQF
jgi:uncharacterized surface protein with fasciclin (FAS1) repeats